MYPQGPHHPGQPGPQQQPGPMSAPGFQPPPGPPGPGQQGPGQPAGFPPGPFHPGPVGGYPPAPPASPVAWPPVLGFVALLLVPLGLAIPFDSSSPWATRLAWSIVATVGVVLALVPLLKGAAATVGMRVCGTVGTGIVLAHWLLIVLPGISSDSGLVVTLGTAAVAGAWWLSGGRIRW